MALLGCSLVSLRFRGQILRSHPEQCKKACEAANLELLPKWSHPRPGLPDRRTDCDVLGGGISAKFVHVYVVSHSLTLCVEFVHSLCGPKRHSAARFGNSLMKSPPPSPGASVAASCGRSCTDCFCLLSISGPAAGGGGGLAESSDSFNLD